MTDSYETHMVSIIFSKNESFDLAEAKNRVRASRRALFGKLNAFTLTKIKSTTNATNSMMSSLLAIILLNLFLVVAIPGTHIPRCVCVCACACVCVCVFGYSSS